MSADDIAPTLRTRARWTVRREALRLVPGPRERPAYAVIGVKRGATTSLDHWIRTHPDVWSGMDAKGSRFFDVNWERGWDWFRAHQPPSRVFDAIERRRGIRPIYGESSPYLCFHPEALARLTAYVPQVRLLWCLRHPVERAWSHYRYEVQRGFERRDPMAALTDELAGKAPDGLAGEFAQRHFTYLGRSRYREQLDRVEDVSSAEQLLILRTEDLVSAPHEAMDIVHAHLGLSPRRVADVRARKAARPAQMPAEVRTLLERELAAEIAFFEQIEPLPPR